MSETNSDEEILAEVSRLYESGKTTEGMALMDIVQKRCMHVWGPWFGMNASRHDCKICGKVEYD
jgi:hypothetical protein